MLISETDSGDKVISIPVPLKDGFSAVALNIGKACRESHQYTDDAPFCFSSSDPSVVVNLLSRCLDLLISWMEANKPSFNSNKTRFGWLKGLIQPPVTLQGP